MSAIECVGMKRVYGSVTAVDHLSLTVQTGEVLGLIGPNGAGKTTTMRMLLGLIACSEGEARLLGEPVPPSPRVLARVGAMIEEPAFYPWMNARRYLRVLNDASPRPQPRDAVDSALERVELSGAGGKHIGHFSQGMKQRLGLAAALLNSPELLIVDEPTNGIDPAGVSWLRGLLRDLADSGTTVVMSSHQLGEVERVCDRVAIIHQGRLIYSGPIADLGKDEERLRIVVPAADHALALGALAAVEGLQVAAGGTGVLYIQGAGGRQVNRLLTEIGIYPESVQQEESSFEECFLKLTGAVS